MRACSIWQSQSTTAENSPTGQRYIHHKERGSKVLLFVREFKADRMTGGAEAVHLSGHGELREAHGQQADEYHLAAGPPNPGEVLEEDK